MKIYLILFLLIASVIIACSKSSSGGGSGNTTVNCSSVSNKAFAADVNPIIQATCNTVNCHNAGSLNGPGPLTNYTQVFNARTDIRGAILAGTMPQNTTLSQSQKNSIACWIDSGAPNN